MACAPICRLWHHMRWVLMTPLGALVEPEVKRNLAMVSGPTWACAVSIAKPGTVASRSANGVAGRNAAASRPAGRLTSVSTTSTSAGNTAAMAVSKARLLANTRPGVVTDRMCRSLAWSCDSSE